MSIPTRDLTPGFGVEILGVDLSRDQPDAVFDELGGLWAARRLLLFRGQELSPERTVDIGSRFGTVQPSDNPYVDNSRTQGRYMYVSNREPDGVAREGSLLFHSDECFTAAPLRALLLYGVTIPERGGDTLFADACGACAELPDRLRRRIESLTALHVYDQSCDRGDRRFRDASADPASPRASHPVVLRHPVTAEPILYVNRLMTDRIVELGPEESESMLDELLDHLYRPEHLYRHRWSRGDLLIWDNRALQHARTDVDPEQERTLRRVPIAD